MCLFGLFLIIFVVYFDLEYVLLCTRYLCGQFACMFTANRRKDMYRKKVTVKMSACFAVIMAKF